MSPLFCKYGRFLPHVGVIATRALAISEIIIAFLPVFMYNDTVYIYDLI